jgi:hypothetical protein
MLPPLWAGPADALDEATVKIRPVVTVVVEGSVELVECVDDRGPTVEGRNRLAVESGRDDGASIGREGFDSVGGFPVRWSRLTVGDFGDTFGVVGDPL